jgi:beta-phosphoglucomutase family hydrolase
MSSDPPSFRAALFDWDGVIIDSHQAHEAAWQRMAEELGIPLREGFFKTTFGMRNDKIIPEYTDWAAAGEIERIRELGDRKEALYREVLRRDGIEPLPGVRELLTALREAGIPCSVGSSTSLENIQTIMEMTGLGPYFDAITAERDVTRGKPDPEVFLKAAAKVQTPAACSVVFEDAHVGIAAALAAGAKAVAVGTTHPLESFTTAHWKVHRLTEVTVKQLQALWS